MVDCAYGKPLGPISCQKIYSRKGPFLIDQHYFRTLLNGEVRYFQRPAQSDQDWIYIHNDGRSIGERIYVASTDLEIPTDIRQEYDELSALSATSSTTASASDIESERKILMQIRDVDRRIPLSMRASGILFAPFVEICLFIAMSRSLSHDVQGLCILLMSCMQELQNTLPEVVAESGILSR